MPSVGSVTYNFKPVTKTAVATTFIAYTANNGELVLVDATAAQFTVTLPASPTAGMQVAVKKIDATANKVIVVGNGATPPTIDGDSSAVLLGMNSAGTFVFDGSTWKVVGTSVFNTATAQGVVPSGGNANQVLTKTTTGVDYAYQWASPASTGGSGQTWGGGRVFTQSYNPATWSTSNFHTYGQNMCLFPIWVPNACTISRLYLGSGSTANSAAVALYTDGGSSLTSGGPQSMVGVQYVGQAQSNAYAQTATSFVVTSGLYWLALAYYSTYTIATVTYNSNFAISVNTAVNSVAQTPTYLYTTSYTYSSTFPASLASTTLNSINYPYQPWVGFYV